MVLAAPTVKLSGCAAVKLPDWTNPKHVMVTSLIPSTRVMLVEPVARRFPFASSKKAPTRAPPGTIVTEKEPVQTRLTQGVMPWSVTTPFSVVNRSTCVVLGEI